ncbi:MAG TPA: endonuclease III [Tepidisphaeraceae bacterium]|nr:endonuclease III [Tepidisphaeraceae bacterium]
MPPQAPTQSTFPIDEVAALLRKETRKWREPIVTRLAREGRNPFKVLITTILSLRTKDTCTAEASERLFALAKTPSEMLELAGEAISKAIYPVGFYRTKTRVIHDVCRDLIERFGGNVPDSIDDLLTLNGVGRKTANLVLTLGFGKHAICVDTHVHRITNRWGYIKTKNPEETEMTLRRILPRRYWIPINDWLVAFGQHVCLPVSPWCSRCVLRLPCARVGVARSR